jgi:hypothetical protein
LLVAAAPTITADAWLGNLAFYPVNTDNTKAIVGLVSQLTFTGTNLAKASSSGAFAAQLTLNGSSAFPAASSHPTPVMDCNAVLGASFSGSIAALAGITPHLIYAAGGTGTVTDYYGVYLRGDVAVASKVTNFTGLYLPAAPSNITNYYPIQIGGGTILGNGAVTWAAASDLVPLAIQGASGQTADLLRLQDSSANVLARFDAAGKLGIGCVPTWYLDVAAASQLSLLLTAAISNQYGSVSKMRSSRGTLSCPTATQSDDFIGRLIFGGYGASAWVDGAQIQVKAAEQYTNTAVGTKIIFALCSIGSTSPSTVLTLGDGAKLGFFGVPPVAQPGAATQTYATADATHAARTYAAPSGGKVIDAECRASLAQLNADAVDTAQLLNWVVDQLQALGAVQ